LDGKGVLITGGKRIGAAVAVSLAGRGAQIALSFNRSRTEAEEVVSTVQAGGGRAFVYQTDLSRAHEAGALVDRAAADMGRLDVLINMASVYSSVPSNRSTSTSGIPS
jgi:3-oxoacyl-[acyl-carrier protein] reductase